MGSRRRAHPEDGIFVSERDAREAGHRRPIGKWQPWQHRHLNLSDPNGFICHRSESENPGPLARILDWITPVYRILGGIDVRRLGVAESLEPL